MYIDSDIKPEEKLNGFRYTNIHGEFEYVKLPDYSGSVKIVDSTGNYCEIFKQDIPKLIKALQDALTYMVKTND